MGSAFFARELGGAIFCIGPGTRGRRSGRYTGGSGIAGRGAGTIGPCRFGPGLIGRQSEAGEGGEGA